jgi:hypothetical protein
MKKIISVSALGRSRKNAEYLDRKSYECVIEEEGKVFAVEVQVTLGDLERMASPEKAIEDWLRGSAPPNNQSVLTFKL